MALFRRKKTKSKPSLPEGVRIYAIADIHGRSDLLRQLFSVIDADLENARADRSIQIFLGDYIDRGAESREVLDLLIERSQSHETVFLKGNHEAFLMDVLQQPAKLAAWRMYGGLPTLMSYGLRPPLNPSGAAQVTLIQELADAIPANHIQFLKELQLSFTCGDFFFVHAGVRPGIPLKQQQEDDMLWIRDEFLECEDRFEKYIVHGHTPVSTPDIRTNRINIDTGAYATGNLTLLIIQDDALMAL